MAWASRMATMAALLTATSGVVLVKQSNGGSKCCISRNNADKFDIHDYTAKCKYNALGWWQKDPKTCAAVKNNKKTYVDLRTCAWKYSKDTNGKPETDEAKIEEVVFSGIRTIEAAKEDPKKMESNVLGDTAPDCVELFKRVFTAAEAEEKPNIKRNIVAGAAYKKLLIEAVIDATERHMDKMPYLLKELGEILKMMGDSKDSHIVQRKGVVAKLVEKMGKANIGYKSETDTENKNVESPNTIGSPGPQSGAKIVSGNTESPNTIGSPGPQSGAKIVSGNTEAVEPPKSKWHACIHKINTLLGIAKKTFVRAMRHQLRAQQE